MCCKAPAFRRCIMRFIGGLGTRWLGWIAAGVAMGGLQALGLVLLAIEPLLFLVQPRMHWKKTLQFLIGLIVIAAGPVGYYVSYDRWGTQVVESGWDSAGLTWIPD